MRRSCKRRQVSRWSSHNKDAHSCFWKDLMKIRNHFLWLSNTDSVLTYYTKIIPSTFRGLQFKNPASIQAFHVIRERREAGETIQEISYLPHAWLTSVNHPPPLEPEIATEHWQVWPNFPQKRLKILDKESNPGLQWLISCVIPSSLSWLWATLSYHTTQHTR